MRREFKDGGGRMPRPGRFYQIIFGFEFIDSNDQLWAASVVGCEVLLFGKRGMEDNF